MEEKMRHAIALERYKLISPVLAEPNRKQNEYFKNLSKKKTNFPHYGLKKLTLPTLKRWLKIYKKNGFYALMPCERADKGRQRKFSEETLKAIEGKCKAFPRSTVRKIYERLLEDNQLGVPPICYNTALRIIRMNELLPKKGRTDTRKRYEYDYPNELWVCDFMHGPQVKTGNKTGKAILCAIIDDHSRVIVGHAFAVHETIATLTIVFKEAILAFGIPKRFYVDNGAAFSADLLATACAKSRISLIHSKPYDSPSRGKIERFFRTVRMRFLCNYNNNDIQLKTLNDDFSAWLRDDYHHRVHLGIKEKPIERYNVGVNKIQTQRLSAAELDQIFLVQHKRIVTNDATISFQGHIYEVPAAYIRQCVDIRHPVDEPQQLVLYDKGVQIAKLKWVNKNENARTFKPQNISSNISYSNGRVKK